MIPWIALPVRSLDCAPGRPGRCPERWNGWHRPRGEPEAVSSRRVEEDFGHAYPVAGCFFVRCDGGVGVDAFRMRRWRQGLHRWKRQRSVDTGEVAALRGQQPDASHDRRTSVQGLEGGREELCPQCEPWACQCRRRSSIGHPVGNRPVLAWRVRPGAAFGQPHLGICSSAGPQPGSCCRTPRPHHPDPARARSSRDNPANPH